MVSFPTATIDTGALRNNLAVVRKLAPGARVMAAVKANAYGHGLIPAAKALADADAFAVARIDEAIALRAAGIGHAIVLLEGVFTAEQLAAAAQHRFDIVVHSFEQIAMLEEAVSGHRFAVWLKVDTGMSRLGFALEDFSGVLARLSRCPAIGVLRLMTHFACAEEPERARTKLQLERFQALAAGTNLERSAANSAGLIAWPESRLEWVRPGLMLYGLSPFADRSAAALGLRPSMTLATRLIALRDVREGERIGYSGIWRAQRPSRIAIAAIGYGDGYPRAMRGGAPVLIDAHEAQIAGRVSMDMTLIDVTDLPEAKLEDVVTLWGEGLPAERVATYADTIAYELVCRVSQRVEMRWT